MISSCAWGMRIIPARAGFTPTEINDLISGRDHPRSRGVYPGGRHPAGHRVGSSPLARGLPGDDPAPAECGGIIPARAGFTLAEIGDLKARKDHPRSRGVYSGGKSPKDQVKGSSPLARGLRHPRDYAIAEGRIIPARAGFTRARK